MCKMHMFLCFFVVLYLTLSVKCFKFLLVFNVRSPSHHFLGVNLGKGLIGADHQVTLITPYCEPSLSNNPNYREILLTGFKEEKEKENMDMFKFGDAPSIITPFMMNGVGNKITERTLQHPNVQRLLRDKSEHFDAVIVEQFVNDAMKAFAHHFNAPLILFSTVGANVWVNPLVGNPSPQSYVPDLFLGYSPKMTFGQRVKNVIINLLGQFNRHFIFFPEQNRIMKKYFPDAPDLSILNYNVSLILLNSHVSTNQPVPLVPNMINIGGFHIRPAKPLPQDIKAFIDGAKDGVIYFSMGSNLKSKNMRKEVIANLLDIFKKLPQRIIWKFEDDQLSGKPDNVMIGKWLPQTDILAHPNVKLFITHGGLLSTTETIYHGVPVLAIPIFGDQKMNAAQMVLNGYGLTISYADLDNRELLSEKLNTLLKDKKYRLTAQTRSRIMKDQPMKPLETAEFWIDYVVRHKGALHLRTAGVDLPWYKLMLLDVWAFIISVVSLILFIIFKLLKCLLKKLRKPKTDSKKKNK